MNNNKNVENIFERMHSKFKITREMREDIKKHPERYAGCPSRIRMGKFYTNEEKEEYFNRALNRKLPGEEQGIHFNKSLNEKLSGKRGIKQLIKRR